MKLIIQVPCFNEEKTLSETLAALPRAVSGFTRVEWLVVDDGSTDDTVRVATQAKVDHLVHFQKNQGLGKAFRAGIQAALRAGADVIVNTDADNQYQAAFVAPLAQAVCAGADMAVGIRDVRTLAHFSFLKKKIHAVGTYFFRRISDTDVADPVSGFRAFSRDAASRLVIENSFSYTLETLLQAGKQGWRITSVPIRTNAPTRPSRLARSNAHFLARSSICFFRAWFKHRPRPAFFASLILLTGVVAYLEKSQGKFWALSQLALGGLLLSLFLGVGEPLWQPLRRW